MITGGTGYIGTNLIRQLYKYADSIILTKNIDYDSYYFSTLDNKKIDYSFFNKKDIVLIHLATYYSKNKKDSKKIHLSNELFGQKLLMTLFDFKLKKVIYSNTMFKYYSDDKIRSLEYTESKNNFSRFVEKETSIRNIDFEEIFFDNSFGNYDTRNKAIPNILNAVSINKPNPIKNHNRYINLIHVDDIVERIIISINSKNSNSSSFINENMVNLESIYNFLTNYKKNNEIKTELLKFCKNDYIKDCPSVNLSGIALKRLDYALTNELKYYENRKFL